MSRKKTIVSVTAGKITAAGIRRDFLKAVKRAEAGDLTPEYRLQFESWELLVQTLTPKRLELIRDARKHPVRKVTELARGRMVRGRFAGDAPEPPWEAKT